MKDRLRRLLRFVSNNSTQDRFIRIDGSVFSGSVENVYVSYTLPTHYIGPTKFPVKVLASDFKNILGSLSGGSGISISIDVKLDIICINGVSMPFVLDGPCIMQDRQTMSSRIVISDLVVDAIQRVSGFTGGRDSVRDIFKYIYLDDGNVVATDSYLLNRVKVATGLSDGMSILIPSIVSDLIPPFSELLVSDTECMIVSRELTISFPVGDKVYPKWQMVLPDTSGLQGSLVVDGQLLGDSVRRLKQLHASFCMLVYRGRSLYLWGFDDIDGCCEVDEVVPIHVIRGYFTSDRYALFRTEKLLKVQGELLGRVSIYFGEVTGSPLVLNGDTVIMPMLPSAELSNKVNADIRFGE